ncbi:hypothetical protein [Legionella maioricensis]|uniref:Uncharacterized protein n=1 Tax=Legionella maioricensis TaxID=2896528 RepID=A0A9X2I9G1_9GAMM|nr:hypothetical protein [Legionella maioricensis]MCL9682746.1 hypothetical protein [Legionella maioricensis]MCL9687206.1 hypothetical protein [Legionella maioricensis]
MLFTLAAVVFCAAIFVFFSQEFIRTFKRIFAIKGAPLILPLAAASWVIYNFDDWVYLVIYYYRDVLRAIVTFLTKIIPLGQLSSYVAVILLLTFISVVPVFVLDWSFRRKTYKPYPYPYLTSTLIWLISAYLLTI